MRITRKQVSELVDRLIAKADEYQEESVKYFRADRDIDGRHRAAQANGLRIAAIEVQSALLTPNAELTGVPLTDQTKEQ